jgi:hypothetical protein
MNAANSIGCTQDALSSTAKLIQGIEPRSWQLRVEEALNGFKEAGIIQLDPVSFWSISHMKIFAFVLLKTIPVSQNPLLWGTFEVT